MRALGLVAALVPAIGMGLRAQCPDGTPPPCATQRAVRAVPAPSPNSVAVLYFDNLSRDTTDAYLADGLAEEIATTLGRIGRLQVKSPSAVRRAQRASAGGLRQLARVLAVRYLVEGSVRRQRERLRVAVRLVSAEAENTVWTDSYTRTTADLLAVEEEIASAVAGGIVGRLLSGERARLEVRPTRNPAAYDLYLRARFSAMHQSEQSLRRAIELYQRALAVDSTYALAHAGIAVAWAWLADIYVTPTVGYGEARSAAARALALDSLLAEAHAAYGMALGVLDFDFTGAEREMRRALELDSSSEYAELLFANFACMFAPLQAEGLAMNDRLMAADAPNPQASWQREVCLYLMRRYDDVVVQHRRTEALDSTFFYADALDGAAWREKGQLDSALAAYGRARRIVGDSPLYGLAVTLARMGRHAEAREVLRALEVRAQNHYVSPSTFAFIHAALGDGDAAFADLERAVEAHDSFLLGLETFPELDSLRTDPRYVALRRRGFGR